MDNSTVATTTKSKPSPLPQSLQRRLLHAFKSLSILTTLTLSKPKVLQPSGQSNHNQTLTPPPSPSPPRTSSGSSPPPSSYSRHQRSTASISLSSVGVDEFLSIYGLESLSGRLRRMGFVEFESLRRANPYHLKRPGGSSASRRVPPTSPNRLPSSRLSQSQALEGLTEHEITELFLALRMWDEEMGPEGEDLRSYLVSKAERAGKQVFRRMRSGSGSTGVGF